MQGRIHVEGVNGLVGRELGDGIQEVEKRNGMREA
jgi:hypothetical protein